MIQVNLEQGSYAWEQWRRGGLGGSDAAAIMGCSPWTSIWGLFRDKCRGRGKPPSDFAMRRGHRYEPNAREAYCRLMRCTAEPQCGEHPDARWMRASTDGTCCKPGHKPWIIEIKAPNWKDHDLALAGIVPHHYMPQVQHVMFVAGVDRCDYVSINDGRRFPGRDQLAVVTVEPDPEWLAEYLERAEKVWRRIEGYRNRMRRYALCPAL